MIREPIRLRDESTPDRLVVVRLGSRTLSDDRLSESCEDAHDRWGIYGFSVLEVPGGDYQRLVRMSPIVADREWVLEASGQDLVTDGFPLLPTGQAPHWTVVLSSPTPDQFERIRQRFGEPRRNPVWRGRR